MMLFFDEDFFLSHFCNFLNLNFYFKVINICTEDCSVQKKITQKKSNKFVELNCIDIETLESNKKVLIKKLLKLF